MCLKEYLLLLKLQCFWRTPFVYMTAYCFWRSHLSCSH